MPTGILASVQCRIDLPSSAPPFKNGSLSSATVFARSSWCSPACSVFMERKAIWNVGLRWGASSGVRGNPRCTANRRHTMDITTLLIIVLVILLLGGGGWYGRGRWFGGDRELSEGKFDASVTFGNFSSDLAVVSFAPCAGSAFYGARTSARNSFEGKELSWPNQLTPNTTNPPRMRRNIKSGSMQKPQRDPPGPGAKDRPGLDLGGAVPTTLRLARV